MFEVVWLQSALNELAAIWVNADSSVRQAITAATHYIDQELTTDPEEKGESRDEGERICFAFPLGVTFQVLAEQSLVRVMHVWDIRRHK
jgi:hypothetical protein